MATSKRIPKEYDVTSYLGRSQSVNSTISAATAKQRQKSFKNLIGPAAGIGMLGATVVGGALGAPFVPAIPVIGSLAYMASEGKHRSERRSQRKAKKKASAAAERYRLGGTR